MKSLVTFSVLVGLAVTPLVGQERDESPFRQLFTIRGVEMTKEQKLKVDQLRKRLTPKLIANQRLRNQLYTAEQRQSRRDAQQAARKAGRRGRQLQAAIDKAVRLSDEQKQKLAEIQKERNQLTAEIQRELRSLLTADQRRKTQRANPARPTRGLPPTHANVKYGRHDRQVMDVWLAKSKSQTPVLVSIHGGGFRGGNKGVDRNLLQGCLDVGISVVAITYRLSDQAIAPAQHYDAARAIQFIRHNAERWNIDPRRIAATGGSAGAGLSLWLGFHKDLVDPDNKDPVLRQSTRLTCMSVYNGQTSYDPRFIRDLFPGTDTYKHSALAQLFDVDLDKLDELPKEKYELFELVSALPHLSKDDVPAQLLYGSKMETPITSQGVGIHHPKFAKVLKDRMGKLGLQCHIHTGVRRGTNAWTNLNLAFFKTHFGIE